MNKPIQTQGNLELVRLENQKLEVYGWIASPHPTPVQNFNVAIDTQEIQDFEQTLGIPSPDVNQIHPHLVNSAKARFRLVIALNSQQIEQYQKSGIALTPIFSEGQGKVMLHNLGTTTPENKPQSESLLPDKISQTTNTLPTVGNFDEAVIQNQQLRLCGWVASLNSGAVEGFQISIAGQEIAEYKHSLGLPSPDVKKAFPKLDNAEVARFEVIIPVSQLQIEEFDDSVVALTPLFKDGKGVVMVKVISVVGGGNKTVNYKIVDSDVILPDGKSIPLPPTPLVVRVHGDSQITGFLKAGWEISRDLKVALKKIGKEFNEFDSVLDFGCGCGRVIIWNSLLSNSTSLYGTDIDAEAISWSQKNLKFANFKVNQALPPTEYEDNQFDLVYLISVFTHINEEMQLQWLEELRRITKPEGIVLITTRRPNTPKEAYELATKLEKEGLVFVSSLGEKKIFPDWYKTTYQTEDYIRNRWATEFEIIDYLPGGIRGNQDIVILRNNRNREQKIEQEQISETTLLPATGYVEQVEISQENQLSIKGWVAAVNSGLLENMKVTFGGVEIQNFQLKKGIPSPDVKISNSHLDAETSRFELSIPLNSEQVEQCLDSYISLTPFFQKGEGTVILKQLALSLPKPKIKPEIAEEQISEITLLPATGYVEQVEISQENQLSIKGWVAAVNSGLLENMKVTFGGVEIQNFQLKKGIPSPDVKISNSHLDAETARFELSIPLNSEQVEQCLDSYISLTPFFQKGEGTVILKQLALSLPKPKNESHSDNQIQIIQTPNSTVQQQTSPESLKQELEAKAITATSPELLSPELSTHQKLEQIKLSSSVLEKIKADLEFSQTEIQEIQADLERFKSRKKNTPVKSRFPVEPDISTTAKKKLLTKPVQQVQNPKIPTTEPKTKQELLGLSGVTVEKFWEILAGRGKKEEGKREYSQPSISILTPTWNSSLDWFVETVLSVLNQSIPNWEWCIVDDGSKQPEIRNVLAGLAEKEGRIKVLFSENNGGISAATNQALDMAIGEYICLLDHDDTLAPTALEDSLNKLAEGFDVVYSDEDKIDFSGLNYIESFFKPDWSPEYFRGVMYVGHLLCVRREIALTAGGFKSEFDGVQDYEFMLRVSEQTNKIAHISQHLYHWRQVKGSISGDADAKAGIEVVQQAAVNSHLQRIGLAAKGEPGLGKHRVNINPLPRHNYPLISLIIAAPNISENLEKWSENLLSVSTYPKNEVILVGGEKTENIIENSAVKVLNLSGQFNYSRAYNLAAKTAQGEYFIFLNTNLEVVTEDWQRHLLYYAEQSDIAAVGGLLIFPDGTVEHAGIVLGKSGKVDYVMRGFPSNHDGYAGSLVCAREVSAVSRDCLMVSRQNFEIVGGFNEHFFSDYQDVDLCLKLKKNGKRIVFTPRSVLINHQSEKHRQRNYDVVDYMLLLDQWQIDMDLGDPYYNLNFDIQRNDYTVVS